MLLRPESRLSRAQELRKPGGGAGRRYGQGSTCRYWRHSSDVSDRVHVRSSDREQLVDVEGPDAHTVTVLRREERAVGTEREAAP